MRGPFSKFHKHIEINCSLQRCLHEQHYKGIDVSSPGIMQQIVTDCNLTVASKVTAFATARLEVFASWAQVIAEQADNHFMLVDATEGPLFPFDGGKTKTMISFLTLLCPWFLVICPHGEAKMSKLVWSECLPRHNLLLTPHLEHIQK